MALHLWIRKQEAELQLKVVGHLIVAVETVEEVVVQMAELVTVAEEAVVVGTADLLLAGEAAGKQVYIPGNKTYM